MSVLLGEAKRETERRERGEEGEGGGVLFKNKEKGGRGKKRSRRVEEVQEWR